MTTPTEAVKAARRLAKAARDDPAIRGAMASICRRTGCKDIYEWAEQHPDMAVEMAEEIDDVMDQTPPGLRPL